MEFTRVKKPTLSLDMAPLIDVVFQLLIFFMLSSSFLVPAMKLSLPKAVEQDQKVPEQIVVSIDKEGRIYLNKTQVEKENLSEEIKLMLAKNEEKSVHIRGDEEMAYRYFVEVMNAARLGGAQQINIMHEGDTKSVAS